MNKSEQFDPQLQELALFARAIAHPARLAVLQFLAQSKTCISGDISDALPLSRTTVSQHLKELKNLDLIQGEIDGLRINYCLNQAVLKSYFTKMESFFTALTAENISCSTDNNTLKIQKNESFNSLHRQ
jgi:DNA-binding transcriptional ArsR family regulator